MEVQRTMKERKEGSEKEDTERHKVAERQGVEDAWKERRRRKEEDRGSLERKREEEDSLTESSDGSCGAECDKEREGDARKNLKVWRGGEKELGE